MQGSGARREGTPPRNYNASPSRNQPQLVAEPENVPLERGLLEEPAAYRSAMLLSTFFLLMVIALLVAGIVYLIYLMSTKGIAEDDVSDYVDKFSRAFYLSNATK